MQDRRGTGRGLSTQGDPGAERSAHGSGSERVDWGGEVREQRVSGAGMADASRRDCAADTAITGGELCSEASGAAAAGGTRASGGGAAGVHRRREHAESRRSGLVAGFERHRQEQRVTYLQATGRGGQGVPQSTSGRGVSISVAGRAVPQGTDQPSCG